MYETKFEITVRSSKTSATNVYYLHLILNIIQVVVTEIVRKKSNHWRKTLTKHLETQCDHSLTKCQPLLTSVSALLPTVLKRTV